MNKSIYICIHVRKKLYNIQTTNHSLTQSQHRNMNKWILQALKMGMRRESYEETRKRLLFYTSNTLRNTKNAPSAH